MTPFSNALVYYRKRAGLSQTNVANRLGVAIQYVWKLERAVKPPPSTQQIERIAAVLNMTQDDVASLLEAALDSQKKLQLPDDLHSDTLRLINRLVRASTSLNGDEVTLLDALVTRLDR
ncbi:XRE family transcriptional regulator [Burkholderia ubonensis]|uniref:helix-turn-helix domain-containing protein n=1 Tax=Burkholderia cepacia complex TaxID=87882 RepID=UPI000752806B|nr:MULTISPECIES: helix-turn-helix transcriptional regulator [Burkholderia cepacia complex]KVM68099.1 XRE family transcriptional regulator [Burkholderia ubonensis]KWN76993.1 XRE family transcriptional regulator [Burkholderia stagnalis]